MDNQRKAWFHAGLRGLTFSPQLVSACHGALRLACFQGLMASGCALYLTHHSESWFKIRKFGVSDVIAITAAGKTAFYYVDKEALVKFNGFLAPKAEGSYLILNEGGYQIEGQTDTWKVIDEKNVQEQRFVQLVCEQTKKQKPDIVLHDSGVLVAQTIYGFDSSVIGSLLQLRHVLPNIQCPLRSRTGCWPTDSAGWGSMEYSSSRRY